MLAELRGWSRFIGLQVPYALNRRDIECELLPMAKSWDMAVLPWGLVGGGVLTGKYTTENSEPTRYNREQLKLREKTREIIEEVQQISLETGRSMAQVAINWVRQQQARAQIIPILGARTAAHLKDNLAVLEWELNAEHLERLHKVSQIEYGFPLEFALGNPYLFGKSYDQIDNHRGNPFSA
jgi:aryl-alcohol dehydrogenase-like predicted oxidoreductase